MSDFVVGTGFFGRELGHFPADQRRRTSGENGRKAVVTPPLDLSDALKVNVHPRAKKKNGGHPSEPDSPIPDTPEELEQQATGDRFIRGYLDFLKSLKLGQDPGAPLDPEQMLKQADDLVHAVTNPLGISDDEIEELTISSEFTLAQVFQGYAQQDGNSARAGVFAGVSAAAHLTADIRTKDGRQFHVEVSIQASVSVQAQVATTGQLQQADPLTLDLDGDGQFSLSDVAGGMLFDINADGALDQSAFVQGGDAFLALDKNGNNQIDNGSELFGDQNGAPNGFAELAKYDSDDNGVIDRNDSVYDRLRALRRDAAGGLTQTSLQELNIEALSLGFRSVKTDAQGGNTITEEGMIFRSSLSYSMADIKLGYRTLSTEA